MMNDPNHDLPTISVKDRVAAFSKTSKPLDLTPSKPPTISSLSQKPTPIVKPEISPQQSEQESRQTDSTEGDKQTDWTFANAPTSNTTSTPESQTLDSFYSMTPPLISQSSIEQHELVRPSTLVKTSMPAQSISDDTYVPTTLLAGMHTQSRKTRLGTDSLAAEFMFRATGMMAGLSSQPTPGDEEIIERSTEKEQELDLDAIPNPYAVPIDLNTEISFGQNKALKMSPTIDQTPEKDLDDLKSMLMQLKEILSKRGELIKPKMKKHVVINPRHPAPSCINSSFQALGVSSSEAPSLSSTSTDLIFEPDHTNQIQLRECSIQGLVDRCLDVSLEAMKLSNVLFLTHRSFMTSQELFELFLDRYDDSDPLPNEVWQTKQKLEGLNFSKQDSAQRKTTNSIVLEPSPDPRRKVSHTRQKTDSNFLFQSHSTRAQKLEQEQADSPKQSNSPRRDVKVSQSHSVSSDLPPPLLSASFPSSRLTQSQTQLPPVPPPPISSDEKGMKSNTTATPRKSTILSQTPQNRIVSEDMSDLAKVNSPLRKTMVSSQMLLSQMTNLKRRDLGSINSPTIPRKIEPTLFSNRIEPKTDPSPFASKMSNLPRQTAFPRPRADGIDSQQPLPPTPPPSPPLPTPPPTPPLSPPPNDEDTPPDSTSLSQTPSSISGQNTPKQTILTELPSQPPTSPAFASIPPKIRAQPSSNSEASVLRKHTLFIRIQQWFKSHPNHFVWDEAGPLLHSFLSRLVADSMPGHAKSITSVLRGLIGKERRVNDTMWAPKPIVADHWPSNQIVEWMVKEEERKKREEEGKKDTDRRTDEEKKKDSKKQKEQDELPPPPPLSSSSLLPTRSRRKRIEVCSLNTLSIVELSRQLALIEFRLYSSIQPEEFVECGWMGADWPTSSPNVKRMIERFNKVSLWVSLTVVMGKTAKERAQQIEFWIKVCQESEKVNNYETVMQIMSGLCRHSVSRMKETWALLPGKRREAWDELQVLTSTSGKNRKLRERLKGISSAYVPFFGMFLTDLVYVSEADTFVEEKKEGEGEEEKEKERVGRDGSEPVFEDPVDRLPTIQPSPDLSLTSSSPRPDSTADQPASTNIPPTGHSSQAGISEAEEGSESGGSVGGKGMLGSQLHSNPTSPSSLSISSLKQDNKSSNQTTKLASRYSPRSSQQDVPSQTPPSQSPSQSPATPSKSHFAPHLSTSSSLSSQPQVKMGTSRLNFAKLRQMTNVISDITKGAHRPYSFHFVEEMRPFLEDPPVVDEETLLRISVSREKRRVE
ncbi:putative Ras-specific guanine nucleotide-releasing factor 1 [Blattamonas nauphoetae]|uniref:Ras-specific guanine nucleotide-releasing factor 1 n=1 Tax=Blattamonas nauphoetae TaxID=2049346 RepID=A0ABQ9XV02_9EUKA|nr:putative Ras-specific guanine nucleotide-releasing factor 1 [Blattamonas nauphoetae]